MVYIETTIVSSATKVNTGAVEYNAMRVGRNGALQCHVIMSYNES
jgi:hypothetical protein